MAKFKSVVRIIVLVLVVIGLMMVVVNNYGFIFSRKIRGEVVGVERLIQATANKGTSAMVQDTTFSFTVAVHDSVKGDILNSTTEDSRWAVVQKGNCVEARFYPYPFWNIEKAGTFSNAQLIEIRDCAKP